MKTSNDEFTISYGLSVDDRKRMLAVIQSISKRRLARAAHISTRTIPSSLAEASEMPDMQLRAIFAQASSLVGEQRKICKDDESMMQWLIRQVGERGLKAVAESLAYDAANLAKVIVGKRKFSRQFRKRVGNQMAVKGNGSV